MSSMWARLRLADDLWRARKSFTRKRVALIGCGSIGAEVAVRLAGCRVERMTLVDGDRVKIHNTPHSTLFRPQDVGSLKVATVARMLKRKYPSAKRRIHVVPAFIQESLAKPRSIFDKSDLVICMVDNDSTRDWVNYHCVNKKRNLIITGMSGPGMEWGGYVMSIKPGQTACFRCLAGSASVAGLGNEHEPKNTVPTDDSNVRRHECGVGDNLPVAMISPVVGLISNLVAIAALKALLDFPEQPNYIYYEARRNMWRTHELKRAKDCAHCAVTSGSSGLILLPKGKLTRIAPEIGKS